MVKRVICPRCEINWMLEKEEYCDVCKAQLGKESPIVLFDNIEDDIIEEDFVDAKRDRELLLGEEEEIKDEFANDEDDDEADSEDMPIDEEEDIDAEEDIPDEIKGAFGEEEEEEEIEAEVDDLDDDF